LAALGIWAATQSTTWGSGAQYFVSLGIKRDSDMRLPAPLAGDGTICRPPHFYHGTESHPYTYRNAASASWRAGTPRRSRRKSMIRFTFLIAAVVVLSIGGMIGYLLPLP
jgi:hypothetical protein